MKILLAKVVSWIVGMAILLAAGVAAATDKPNILVIFGDDIGMYNISAYHRGMMGGSTPNIDRIALFSTEFLKAQLEGMTQTHRDDGRSYWHIQIHCDGKAWILHRRKDQDWPDITDKMVLRVRLSAQAKTNNC